MVAAIAGYQQNAGAVSQPRALITETISETELVTLAGNTRPEATAANDRGPLADSFPMEHLWLQLRRSPEREQALERYIDQFSDRKSPNYHHWLTAKQFGERYGLAQEDLAAITGWLGSHGFTVNLVYPSRVLIDFSGTAGQVREAFHAEIHNLEVNGEQHIANMSDPRIPAALAPAVVGVVSLNNFMPRPLNKPRPAYTYRLRLYHRARLLRGGTRGPGHHLQSESAVCGGLFGPGADDRSRRRQRRLQHQRTGNRIGTTSVRNSALQAPTLAAPSRRSIRHPAPAAPVRTPASMATMRSDLDVEWASAAAPNAAIELASCADTTTNFGGFIALQNILSNGGPVPAIVSISYGESEPSPARRRTRTSTACTSRR